jgi:DNA-binding response OmpR family regulator
MLTAWKSELSRMIGLATGAEDYVTKPFSPRDLVQRVNRTLRSHEAKALEREGNQ